MFGGAGVGGGVLVPCLSCGGGVVVACNSSTGGERVSVSSMSVAISCCGLVEAFISELSPVGIGEPKIVWRLRTRGSGNGEVAERFGVGEGGDDGGGLGGDDWMGVARRSGRCHGAGFWAVLGRLSVDCTSRNILSISFFVSGLRINRGG